MADLEVNAYVTALDADTERNNIMQSIRNAVTTTSGSDVYVNIGGTNVDISTGAGALVLDDKLQKLSNQEQAAAQLVSSKNRGQKEVNQMMR